jgi:hypothetical protein
MRVAGAGVVLLLALTVSSAQAVSYTFVTAAGSTAGGQPVDAKVEFDLDPAADTLAITLRNLQANPTSVIQNVSDLFFTISTAPLAGSVTSSSGMERNVAEDGTYSDPGVAAAGWVLTDNDLGRFHLDVLTSPGVVPSHTLLGPPGGATYAGANDSIAGNDSHNPFLAEVVTFLLSIPGLDTTSTITEATFSFGTAAGTDVTGVLDGGGPPAAVPEPTTMVLWATTTLIGGGIARWRRSRQNNS